MPPKHNKNSHFKLLFISDPHLGKEGFNIINKYFQNITCIIWEKDHAVKKREIRSYIQSNKWDILISFYNDFIFTEDDLMSVEVPLNIHPASPQVRGVAYDTLPLIEGHRKYGSTVHKMTNLIDDGEIIDIIEDDLPDNISFTQFRPLTQQLSLVMLEKLSRSISRYKSLPEIHQFLNKRSKKTQVVWSKNYYSRQKLDQVLNKLKTKEPYHKVFK